MQTVTGQQQRGREKQRCQGAETAHRYGLLWWPNVAQCVWKCVFVHPVRVGDKAIGLAVQSKDADKKLV